MIDNHFLNFIDKLAFFDLPIKTEEELLILVEIMNILQVIY